MPLQVLIIGAGIAGLTAAASLRKAGHSVQIFEKSAFAAETGAALVLAPNGAHVLSALGFSFERARVCRMNCWEIIAGHSLQEKSSVSFDNAIERFGKPVCTIHRVDLHNELLRLALDPPGGAKLYLSSSVVNINPEDGIIELADGSVHRGDLIVAADGLHSVARDLVVQAPTPPVSTGLSAFRFLIPSEILENTPSISEIYHRKSKGVTIIPDVIDTANERHVVWYECRGGEVHNFVGIHPTRSDNATEGYDYKNAMLAEFSQFHPDLLTIFKNAEDVKCWPLSVHEPLNTWVKGKLVLIGDAAHPMLPFGGQGSNQAIEDGGALGQLLVNIHDPALIPKRLHLFQKLRKNRASRIQILSRVRVGNERQVESELRKYMDTLETVPTSFADRLEHDYNFNLPRQCVQALAEST